MSDIEQRIKDAAAAFEKLPPKRQAELRERQRRSWVVGELMLENPDMTEQYANQLYDEARSRNP